MLEWDPDGHQPRRTAKLVVELYYLAKQHLVEQSQKFSQKKKKLGNLLMANDT
jgi:hypothetical protein